MVVAYTLSVAARVELDSTRGAKLSGNEATVDFPLVEQGYDPSKVDEYVATQVFQLGRQVDAAADRIAELEDELSAANAREDAIQLTMMAATKTRDELLAKAKQDAEEMVADARRAAFVLMTESRNDADRAIAESKSLVDMARTEALSLVTAAKEETARLVTERKATLAKLQASYEAECAMLMDRINTLRSMSDELNVRIPAPPDTETSQAPPSPNEGRTADAPPVENTPDQEDDDDAPIAGRPHGSFFGHRSAELPRIGEGADRSAQAAAPTVQAHLNREPDESPPAGDDDLAVRTA